MFIVFTFNTQVKTWYSNIKKVVKFKVVIVGEIDPIHCVFNSVLKRKTLKGFFLSRMLCYAEKTRHSP